MGNEGLGTGCSSANLQDLPDAEIPKCIPKLAYKVLHSPASSDLLLYLIGFFTSVGILHCSSNAA